jgi:hypothetical protein
MREAHRAHTNIAQALGVLLAAVFVIAVIPSKAARPAAATTVPCRVLEAGTSQRFGMAIVIFHYRDEANRARLGALLREYDGETAQFSTADGNWHTATVLRLKTCFGRGLLLFPAAQAHLAAHDQFILKFPPLSVK